MLPLRKLQPEPPAPAVLPFPAPAAGGFSRKRLPAPVFGLRPLLGCLVEISGGPASGALTAALRLVAEAQEDEERHGFVAWVGSPRSVFYPPDAERSGAAPERIVLVRVEGTEAQIRAATHLAHAGAFGLVVVDLADAEQPRLGGARRPFRSGRPERSRPRVPPLARLSALARRHGNAVVLLTAKGSGMPSLDPRIVKRYDASRRGPQGKELAVTVLKDKGQSSEASLPPGFRFEGVCREPNGLR